ncbi:MAG: UDP-N-acetylmuramate--L-alanine ligase [Actinomycetota bacterium]
MTEQRVSVVDDLGPAHLIGVGGAGMSAIAKVLLMRGVPVSGSDMKESPGLAALRALGARIVVGHDAANVGEAASVVVSSAIRDSNPELRAAQARGVPVLHRAQVLALLMRERRGIAVAGTHGKTTTTSMIALILQRAGFDPSFLVGGELNEGGTNAHHGAGEWLVAEADESDGSLLWLGPEVAVITNIEAEHLDYYRDEAEVRETFLAFMGNVAPSGVVVACAQDPGVAAVAPRAGRRLVTYAVGTDPDVEWTADRTCEGERRWIDVRRGGHALGRVELGVPGEHNALNALGALAAASEAGVEFGVAAEALAAYQGVARRFQTRGAAGGVTVVDDYAHHPTEVRATLAAAREHAGGGRRILAVFQPHLYSRTEMFGRALGEALSAADLVVVTDVYGAREDPRPGISGKIVVDGVLAASPRRRVAYLPKRGDIAGYIADRAHDGDVVLTIGAGDVTMLGSEILRRIGERSR